MSSEMLEATTAEDIATTATQATAAAVASPASDGECLVESDLLVEDVSIDGMCGVY